MERLAGGGLGCSEAIGPVGPVEPVSERLRMPPRTAIEVGDWVGARLYGDCLGLLSSRRRDVRSLASCSVGCGGTIPRLPLRP